MLSLRRAFATPLLRRTSASTSSAAFCATGLQLRSFAAKAAPAAAGGGGGGAWVGAERWAALAKARKTLQTILSGAEDTTKARIDVFQALSDNTAKKKLPLEAKRRKPSDRVIALADQVMSLTLVEAADLCDLCQDRLSPGDDSPIPGRMPFPHPMGMFPNMPPMPPAMPMMGAMAPQMAMPQMMAAPQMAAAPDAAAAPAADAADAGKKKEKKEEAAPAVEDVNTKKEVSVKMTAIEASTKIKVLKLVREVLSLGLKETKEFIESLPKVVKKGIPQEEADDLMKKFQEAGATMVKE